ncbi:O-antigen ligase family protein [Pseudoalteromonas sp.]|uniref:O-antigen ligase family protein n=2 Tax=Pseudoalteromonas sp. TaxID=53249 RepID=UPI00355ABDCE
MLTISLKNFYIPFFLLVCSIPFLDSFYLGLFNEKRAAQIVLLALCAPLITKVNYSKISCKFQLTLALLFFLAFLSVFFSENSFYSSLLILHYILLLGIIVLGMETIRGSNLLFKTSIAISIFLSGYFLLNFFFYLSDNIVFPSDGVFAGFYNIRFFNQLQLIFIFYSLFFIKKKKYQSIALISLTLNLLIIFISSARGALLATLITLFLGYYIKIIKRKELNFIFKALTLSISLYILYLYLQPPSSFDKSLFRETSSGRIEMWIETIRGFDIKTLFVGNGAGTYSYTKYSLSHPHNIFLSLIHDWGLLFTITLMYILNKVIFKSIKHIKENKHTNEFKISFLTLISLLLLSFVSGTLVMPMSQTFVFLSIGFLLGSTNTKNLLEKPKSNIYYSIYIVIGAYLILSAISFNCLSNFPFGPNFWSNGQVSLSNCELFQ